MRIFLNSASSSARRGTFLRWSLMIQLFHPVSFFLFFLNALQTCTQSTQNPHYFRSMNNMAENVNCVQLHLWKWISKLGINFCMELFRFLVIRLPIEGIWGFKLYAKTTYVEERTFYESTYSRSPLKVPCLNWSNNTINEKLPDKLCDKQWRANEMSATKRIALTLGK